MARKRIDLGHVAEDQIRALMARGGTVESITAALRAGGLSEASPATVSRRMAEMRRGVNEARVDRRGAAAGVPGPALVRLPSVAAPEEPVGQAQPVEEAPLPRTPEEIPAGSSLADYDRWIARAERMADDAEVDGDLKAIGNFARLVGFFMAERRKAAPDPVPDPNDAPDMVALGAQVEERFLKMIDMVLEET